MNKNYLFRKASVINAIKCNKSSDFEEAIKSYDVLIDFKTELTNSDKNEDLPCIQNKIDQWALSEPIANKFEINAILVNK